MIICRARNSNSAIVLNPSSGGLMILSGPQHAGSRRASRNLLAGRPRPNFQEDYNERAAKTLKPFGAFINLPMMETFHPF
jgi:hypothetical protein